MGNPLDAMGRCIVCGKRCESTGGCDCSEVESYNHVPLKRVWKKTLVDADELANLRARVAELEALLGEAEVTLRAEAKAAAEAAERDGLGLSSTETRCNTMAARIEAALRGCKPDGKLEPQVDCVVRFLDNELNRNDRHSIFPKIIGRVYGLKEGEQVLDMGEDGVSIMCMEHGWFRAWDARIERLSPDQVAALRGGEESQ